MCIRDSREGIRRRAKIIIVVFDEGGQRFPECIFGANTDGPALPRLACRREGDAGLRGKGTEIGVVPVALPSDAALYVRKEAVECVADAAGDGTQSINSGTIVK